MFSLTNDNLRRRILGCGDSPASFNAATHQMGNRVVSIDPLYQFSAEEIRGRIRAVCLTILEQLVANQSAYVWTTVLSTEDLGRIRMKAMEEFLADYEFQRGSNEMLRIW
jgi:hypothetical protein